MVQNVSKDSEYILDYNISMLLVIFRVVVPGMVLYFSFRVVGS